MFIMIGSTDCPKCVQVKELLKKEGLLGKVHYYDSHSKEGKKIVDKYQPKHVPFFISNDKPINNYMEFLKTIKGSK